LRFLLISHRVPGCDAGSELFIVAFSLVFEAQKNGDRRAVTIRCSQHRGRRLQTEEDTEERDNEQDQCQKQGR